MTKQEKITTESAGVSRRGFMAGSVGLSFAFTVSGFMTGRSADVAAAASRADINGWVTIGVDGSITIAAPAAEMGQGVFTSIPMIVAEEMDADWSKVAATFPPPIPKKFGNPRFGGFLVTVASRSIDGYWDKIRMHGAEVRRVLLDAAAAKWGVPVGELSTEPSVVVHKKTGRRLSYGEIASFAKVPKQMPKLTAGDLKKPADFRIIGKSIPRLDVPQKVDGSAPYGMDVQVPGMLYAAVVRSPVEGGRPLLVDEVNMREVKGVKHVVKLKNAVGVIGTTYEAAKAGRDALKIGWGRGKAHGYNSDKAMEEFKGRAAKADEVGLPFKTTGDARAAIKGAKKVYKADYQSDYTYHAQMEPMNVTASVAPAGDAAELWLGTQAPNLAALVASKVLKTKPNKIKVNQQFLGGGFGRRLYPDLVPDAIILAKVAKAPVKLIWSREDDVGSGKLRPMTAHRLEAGLDANGRVVGWRHKVVGESVIGYTGPPARLKKAKGVDVLTMEGAKHYYEISNQSVEFVRENRNVALAAWRSIGSGYNKFAVEAFMDEIAHGEGKDPVKFRLELLNGNARARKVIETAAEMADWGKKRNGTALGIAFVDVWSTLTAGVMEVSVDKASGKVKVHNFWSAVDPGIVVNPDVIVQQTESNVAYGISQALKERITFVGGAIQQSNFHDYGVLRMSEMPAVHTRVIATDNHPTGIGEIALPLIGGALSNAIFAATGARMRHMPFTPERVKAALKA